MQPTSPVPRNSPLTVTTTTRYESSSRNHVSSPRNYSLSPTSQIERASPVNYVPASTQRVASPISMQRVTSPITTITHRVTSPLTSPLTVKVISAHFFILYVFIPPFFVRWTKPTIMNQQWQQTNRHICFDGILSGSLCYSIFTEWSRRNIQNDRKTIIIQSIIELYIIRWHSTKPLVSDNQARI